jgi:RHS repeat-associated protein
LDSNTIRTARSRSSGGYLEGRAMRIILPTKGLSRLPGAVQSGLAGTAGVTDLSLGYYADDSARSLTQNGVTTTFTLDPPGRRSTSTTAPAAGGAATETIDRHYTDESDNPSWAVTTTGSGTGTSTTTRYAESLGGDLAATITTGSSGGTAISLPLVNMHGDAVSTITVPTDGSACTGLDSWTSSDEYGNPLTPTTPGANTVTGDSTSISGIGYGWLGGEQRATDTTGLLLMGARLYNPASGQFTSLDPVFGGNSTAYSYPQDPVNMFDLNGQWHWWKGHYRRAVISKKEARDLAKTFYAAASNSKVVEELGQFIPIGGALLKLIFGATHKFFHDWADQIMRAVRTTKNLPRVELRIGIQQSDRHLGPIHAYRFYHAAWPTKRRRTVKYG